MVSKGGFMLARWFVDMVTMGLLVVIAAATVLIAARLSRIARAGLADRLYDRRLAVYREVVRVLSIIARDADVPGAELILFRSKTHESGFVFGRDVASYIDEIYDRSLRLHVTTSLIKGKELPVGEDRDKITVENSKHMIWLTDQVPMLRKKFEAYLKVQDLEP
jgi:hypothetical protein